ncbi:MAG: sulfatase-like hydrolase/transferase, partial [bacterium]|nr:sulfatase-like hydrolase/transferase [bacterium]
PGHRDTAGNQEVTRKTNRTRAVYKSMVESMDSNVGRILAQLKTRGLEEKTAVFFMSDNGGLPDVARNTPFRAGKGTLFEGGIRSPLMARWKGVIPPGTTSRQLAAGMDLFPTALEIAGAGVPRKHRLDGVSLMTVAKGWNRLTHDTLTFHYDPPNVKRPWKAMIRDGWKSLQDKDGREFLFHLREDIGE